MCVSGQRGANSESENVAYVNGKMMCSCLQIVSTLSVCVCVCAVCVRGVVVRGMLLGLCPGPAPVASLIPAA